MLAGGISNPTIDKMVATALSSGAVGSKISGAGGGGFLLSCCEKHKQDRLKIAMESFREMPFFLERYGSKINYNIEGYEWK